MNLDGATVTIIVFLICQTTGIVWWASKLTATVGFISVIISELKAGGFVNCSVHSEQILALQKRLTHLENRK